MSSNNTSKSTATTTATAKKQAQKSNSSMLVKRDIKQEVTDRIIEIMERGPESWQKTWTTNNAGLPVNAATGAVYRGINVLILIAEARAKGYTSNQWMTYKQALAFGGQVKKGEKGTGIIFYQMIDKKEDDTEEEKRFPVMKNYCVFNRDQIQNLPDEATSPTAPAPANPGDDLSEAQLIIDKSGARIDYGNDRAAYIPALDKIIMPHAEQFKTPEYFYSVSLHELAHWTGHPDRLNRDLKNRFGSEAYAMEELTAELTAAFCATTCGFENQTIESHASYLSSWIRVLKNDKNAIFTAAAQAQAAFDFLTQD